MSDTLSEAFAMKAAKPSVVLDGGDVEDPEGDTDVNTAESDEEGGGGGNLFRLSQCVRWPVPGLASGTAAVQEPLDNTYMSTWLCISCNPHCVQIRTRSKRMGSFFSGARSFQ